MSDDWDSIDGDTLQPSGGKIIENLSDDECALFAILSDISGLDQAEFLWVNEGSEDKCWRAWPFQHAWWRTVDIQQVDQNGRSTGKTESIKARACAFPFNYPNEEMVVVGPEKIHVSPLTDKIEAQIRAVWVFREMLVAGRQGTSSWPFRAKFRNGARILSRIPQRDGRGFKGIHPAVLEADEAQDLTEKAWIELRPTLKREAKNASWRVHGVSKGIPDEFQKITQEGSGWKVHKYTAYCKPTWNEEEQQSNIDLYGGSKDHPDYRRNVLGWHGDNQNAIFVLSRLMEIVDSDEGSDYNQREYHRKTIAYERAQDIGKRQGTPPEEYGDILVQLLELPSAHTEQYPVFWVGMDVGIAKDPSAIMVLAEYVPSAAERRMHKAAGIGLPEPGVTRFKLVARIELQRVPVPDQAQILIAIVEHYRPRAFSIDSTGNGLGILQELQQQARISRLMRIEEEAVVLDDGASSANQALTVIKGYNFGVKIPVEIDEAKAAELPPGLTNREIIEQAGIRKQVKEYATDQMRRLVDTKRILLPYDENLIRQLTGQTWTHSQSQTDAYGNRTARYSEGAFHCLVAGTMVRTSAGEVPIEDIRPGMLVETRAGLRPVLDAWQTSPAAPVMTVKFSNGATLTGTPEHRVWTGRSGWVQLQNLHYGDEVVEWKRKRSSPSVASCRSGLFSTGRRSIATRTARDDPMPSTSQGRRISDDCMKRSGSTTTERSRRGTTSTTPMVTRSITLSRTWSASAPRSMPTDTPRSTSMSTSKLRGTFNIWRRCVHRPLNGIGLPRDAPGTASMASGLPRRLFRRLRSVNTAGGSTPRRSRDASATFLLPANRRLMPMILHSRSPVPVRRAGVGSHVGGTPSGRTATTVVRRRAESQLQAVYDITVAGEPEFFANGVLVHNSFDGLRMAVLGMVMEPIEMIQRTKPPPRQPVFARFGD